LGHRNGIPIQISISKDVTPRIGGRNVDFLTVLTVPLNSLIVCRHGTTLCRTAYLPFTGRGRADGDSN
jgi:hypothetical protein